MNASLDEIKKLMVSEIAKETDAPVESIDQEKSFQELGLDSISSVYMINELEDKFEIQLKALHLLEYPTVNSFSKFVFTLANENK